VCLNVHEEATYCFASNFNQLSVGSFKLRLKLTLVLLNHQRLHRVTHIHWLVHVHVVLIRHIRQNTGLHNTPDYEINLKTVKMLLIYHNFSINKAVVAGTAGTAMAIPIIRPTMYEQS